MSGFRGYACSVTCFAMLFVDQKMTGQHLQASSREEGVEERSGGVKIERET